MLINNKDSGTVIGEIRKAIASETKLSILTSMFSIYGFYALKGELSQLSETRLLYANWNEASDNELVGSASELKLKNKLDQHFIAGECLKWLQGNVQIRALLETAPQNLFHLGGSDKGAFAVQGSSQFTASGLGEVESDKSEMNVGFSDEASTESLLSWFDDYWNKASVQDIKTDLLQKIDLIASDKSGSLIYFLTLYNLFQDFIEDIDEDNIIRSKTGIKDSVIWHKLYKFQKDGVLGAIDKLEKYNGCIIADSVGLGKTFEALAVIKYYELRNDRVLVLAPKKLRDNWTVYTLNDKRNLLASDRLHYDVLNHTDLTRKSGKSGEIDLKTINWENYDLIVIDESHNFRNNNTKKEGITRYRQLMENVIKAGVPTKVLMLSATPVNSRMNDLKNQVAFITEGIDTALSEHGIANISNTLRLAQTQFNAWLSLPDEERGTDTLLERLSFDYFKLLDLLTIARSRQHIEKYYDSAEIGEFPVRLKPDNIKTDIDTDGIFSPMEETNKTIKRLTLAAYTPLKYVRMDKKDAYGRKYDQQVKGGASVFRQLDRDSSLIHLMRVNMLKRMESSVASFALTVERTHSQIEILLERIEAHKETEIESLDIEEIETDDPEMEEYLSGNKVKVLIQDIDLVKWKQDLAADHVFLGKLLEDARTVEPQKDAKLLRLKNIISNKIKNPINAGNRKIIIFTAFSDTAKYLYQHIAPWVAEQHKLESALVIGSGTNKCTIKGLPRELNTILTYFSPRSKERDKIDPDADVDIDILIATDCISEGQNLQDCDMLVNYDIHWNPVRIIQRFGRIDRLGSINKAIQLVNFWPNMELDEYINLESRVSGRMVLLDISATGEENVIDTSNSKKMNDLEYRRKQMKQLQEAVVDLEDMEGSVSITDMTLNDFRMDLSGYMKDNRTALERAPTGFFAALTPSLPEAVEGTIFCLRDIHGKVQTDKNYALAPYYMVYVSQDLEVVLNHLQSKKSLDIFRKLCANQHDLDKAAIDRMNQQTQQGQDMGLYQDMLQAAIESIIGKSEEKGMASLFSRGGMNLAQGQFKGLEDFEVVTFLVISGRELPQ